MRNGIKNQIFLLTVLLQFISVSGWAAQPMCNALADCQTLHAHVDARIEALQAGQIPVFLDTVEDASGRVKYLNQRDAIQYCASQGNHLPNARELARLSTSHGAKGIVGSCGSDSKCYPVQATNADGTHDKLYLSYDGYQSPAGDLGNNWFWSSSSSSNPAFGFILIGDNGSIDRVGWINNNAVLCVAGP